MATQRWKLLSVIIFVLAMCPLRASAFAQRACNSKLIEAHKQQQTVKTQFGTDNGKLDLRAFRACPFCVSMTWSWRSAASCAARAFRSAARALS
jgi:hypothetical protein